VFERFTERARQVVVLAQDEARRLGHNYLGTEHLLLGLLREEQGLGSRLLQALGVTLDRVRDDVRRIIGEGEAIQTGQIPFTPRAKKVLERSLREAKSLKHGYIGTEHILLGLVRVDDGVAARILRDLGADAETVHNEVMRMLGAPSRAHPIVPPAPAEYFEPTSPPFAPDVAAELARLSGTKQDAIERGDFAVATRLRDRERRVIEACRAFLRVWNEPNELP
jgi:ATP-dependent Clp protease ATP-binding subunit ClpC